MDRNGDDEIDFCTLGMFIIDDIYPAPSDADQTPRLDVVGGAGTYSAIGARILSPPPLSKRVGWIVDCGTDFPVKVQDVINSWQTGVLMRQRDGLTTKGWNGYGDNEHRAFKYLTPKLRLTDSDLSPALLRAKSFHLICSPLRCIELVKGVKSRRAALDRSLPHPLFVWEPVPDLCVEAELENTIAALECVDVISPNHAELAELLSVKADAPGGGVDKQVVEECGRRIIESVKQAGKTDKVGVVVRSGKDGCYVTSTEGVGRWLPAYHTSASKVVDPTGGGNSFLGGFAVGLARTGDLVKAAIWGNVGASFCIEQVGAPVLGKSKDGRETWNGVVGEDRLSEFEERCAGL